MYPLRYVAVSRASEIWPRDAAVRFADHFQLFWGPAGGAEETVGFGAAEERVAGRAREADDTADGRDEPLGGGDETAGGGREPGPSVFDVVRAINQTEIALHGPEPLPGPWFGGAAFDPTREASDAWAGFPSSRWILPEVLCWRRGESLMLGAAGPVPDGTDPDAVVHALEARLDDWERSYWERAAGHVLNLDDGLGEVREVHEQHEDWARLVEASLAAIEEGRFVKVVPARAIDLRLSVAPNVGALLSGLDRAATPATTRFVFRGGDGALFVGATPELLCQVEGGRLRSEALAGSGPPGSERSLRESKKDLAEHAVVVDAVSAELEAICDSLHRVPHPRVVRLPSVLHLQTPFEGKLKEGRSLADAAEALHPTPAVAGLPKAPAVRFLAEHEQLDRGWYSGLVGWLGPEKGCLRVALRCALVHGDRARIFVGAGVVRGSSPEQEWRETRAKAGTMLLLFGAEEAMGSGSLVPIGGGLPSPEPPNRAPFSKDGDV